MEEEGDREEIGEDGGGGDDQKGGGGGEAQELERRKWRRKQRSDSVLVCRLQIVLETEFDNLPSLALYISLGFFKEKRLWRFYMNGKDA